MLIKLNRVTAGSQSLGTKNTTDRGLWLVPGGLRGLSTYSTRLDVQFNSIQFNV